MAVIWNPEDKAVFEKTMIDLVGHCMGVTYPDLDFRRPAFCESYRGHPEPCWGACSLYPCTAPEDGP